MELARSAEHKTFRQEVRSWLSAHVPDPPLAPPGTPEGFAAHREWERTLADADYSAIHWPVEYGGRGADVVSQAIFEEEYLLAGGPDRITVIGHNLLGPALMVHGTVEQRAAWLPEILSARVIWSQGFSEPDAGSDLAAVRTRAEPDADGWVVNGQKIWTSYGSYADFIFALVRTDPAAQKHAGLSMIAVDLRSEGVETRPIRQIDGHAGFAEVFFTDVRAPATNVIGRPGEGWTVAMTMLGFERDAPAAAPARYERDLAELAVLVRALGLQDDPVVEERVGWLAARAEAYRGHALRTLDRLAHGESLGAEASITKLLWSELEQDLYETARDILGPYAEAIGGSGPLPPTDGWRSRYWYARAATIYAGTSEIQRNIIAERVLALPKG